MSTLHEQKTDKQISLIVVAIFAAIALVASFVLSVEKVHLLENPNAELSCSINALFNCASVMQSPQASVFGIPNTYFGMIGFTVILTLAVAGLYGLVMPRWMLWTLYAGIVGGWIAAIALYLDSLYVLKVLCPWCLVVTTSTTAMTMAMTRYLFRRHLFELGSERYHQMQRWLDKQYDIVLFSVLVVVLVALGIVQFGDSF